MVKDPFVDNSYSMIEFQMLSEGEHYKTQTTVFNLNKDNFIGMKVKLWKETRKIN